MDHGCFLSGHCVSLFVNSRAKDYLAQFYSSDSETSLPSSLIMGAVTSLPDMVLVCLAALLRYLEDFGLGHVFKTTEGFKKFTERVEMCLNGNTLHNLEVSSMLQICDVGIERVECGGF